MIIAHDPGAPIRSFAVADPAWQRWLRAFPSLPGREGPIIDWYIDRIGPYLHGKPKDAFLADRERLELRGLLKDYANALLRIQKRANVRLLVDIAGVCLSGAAYFLVPGLELASLIFGPLVIGRNQLADKSWKERKRSLDAISKWIQNLV